MTRENWTKRTPMSPRAARRFVTEDLNPGIAVSECEKQVSVLGLSRSRYAPPPPGCRMALGILATRCTRALTEVIMILKGYMPCVARGNASKPVGRVSSLICIPCRGATSFVGHEDSQGPRRLRSSGRGGGAGIKRRRSNGTAVTSGGNNGLAGRRVELPTSGKKECTRAACDVNFLYYISWQGP